jgi:hypothetical protein
MGGETMPRFERCRKCLSRTLRVAGRDEARLAMNYFLYQKIATATRMTVMIQRMMSLLRFFSFGSAMQGSTAQSPLSIQVVFWATLN